MGDVILENVTVLEAGDFSFDLSAGGAGRVSMKNCRADIAYNPLFNLTRGEIPEDALFDVTILNATEEVEPTARSGLGTICGRRCTFILRDGTTRPLPEESNRLLCGGKKGLEHSTVINYTGAKLVLNERVRHCEIKSRGPVEDHGRDNIISRIASGNTDDG